MKVLQLEEALKAEKEKSLNLQSLYDKCLNDVDKWKSMFEEVAAKLKMAEAESTKSKQQNSELQGKIDDLVDDLLERESHILQMEDSCWEAPPLRHLEIFSPQI